MKLKRNKYSYSSYLLIVFLKICFRWRELAVFMKAIGIIQLYFTLPKEMAMADIEIFQAHIFNAPAVKIVPQLACQKVGPTGELLILVCNCVLILLPSCKFN